MLVKRTTNYLYLQRKPNVSIMVDGHPGATQLEVSTPPGAIEVRHFDSDCVLRVVAHFEIFQIAVGDSDRDGIRTWSQRRHGPVELDCVRVARFHGRKGIVFPRCIRAEDKLAFHIAHDEAGD